MYHSYVDTLAVNVGEPDMETCVRNEDLLKEIANKAAKANGEEEANSKDNSIKQFITQIVNGRLVTEEVLRVGKAELPTTSREMEEKGTSKEQIAGDKEKAENKRLDGNGHFKKEDYGAAAVCYTDALILDPTLYICYANRSACFLKLGQHEKALEDAEACTLMAPHYVKGWFRKGLALHAKGSFVDAIYAFEEALKLEPNNKQVLCSCTFVSVTALSSFHHYVLAGERCSTDGRIQSASATATMLDLSYD